MNWLLPRLSVLVLVAFCGCQAEEPVPTPPESITLMVWSPDRILGPISARLPAFTKKTGIRVKVKPAAELADIFAASQSPNHDVDVAIGLNLWVGDFVNGFIEPLDRFIAADMANDDPELSWATIPEGVRRKNTWGGHTYSMILDNDNMFLIYRKDVLSDPAFQEPFRAQFNYPLPNPPATIEQLIDVATFFNDKDWDNDGAKERGFAISRRVPDQLMYWYALAFTTPYTVMPAAVSEANKLPGGLFMFKPDMSPLVSTPGFKEGIRRWLTLARMAAPNTGRQETIDQIVRGEALMAIDWGDTGPAALAPGSIARGKLGYAISPGSTSYYNWVTQTWAQTGANVHNAPLHQANGFAFYMTSTSNHKDAVWKFIKYMNSPDVSMGIVSDPRGGYQPWRTTHTDVAKWVEAGWQREDAANYVDAILRSLNHPNVSLDLRIPGIFEYGAVLEKHLVKLLEATTPDVDKEMDACANEMTEVTNAYQPEAQRAALRAHHGLPQ